MNTSRQTKIRSIVVLVVAAIFLELTTAVQYISTRRAITAQITEMAKHDLTSANRTFEVKEIAEAAIAALQRVVANHPEIVGVDFAYRVGSDGLRDGYFTFKDDATNEIKDTVIGFDYTERTWYREGLHGNGSWSEPYMSRYYVALMSTFSRPVHDPQGRVVAVIGADVPMRELSSMAVQLYDNQQRSLIPVIIFQLIGLVVLGFIMYRSILSVRKLCRYCRQSSSCKTGRWRLLRLFYP